MSTKKQTTNVYTFQVNMTVEILSESPREAREKLDQQGGYISSRSVRLKSTTELKSEEEPDEE